MYHVLLIDDDPIVLSIRSQFLETKGCETDVSQNADQALEFPKLNFLLFFSASLLVKTEKQKEVVLDYTLYKPS